MNSILNSVALTRTILVASVLCALLLSVADFRGNIWRNIGFVTRNHSLIATTKPASERDKALTQSLILLEKSDTLESCNPFGFGMSLLNNCMEIENWEQIPLILTDAITQTAYLATPELDGLMFREFQTFLLPTYEFRDLNSVTIFTFTSHSTRIHQGDLIGHIMLRTLGQDAFLVSLYAGIETAESMYDSPDISPLHDKPTVYLPRNSGGLAYPVTLTFEKPASLESITAVFLYPYSWHIAPRLYVWAISPGGAMQPYSHESNCHENCN
jgi:hypothetical protein